MVTDEISDPYSWVYISWNAEIKGESNVINVNNNLDIIKPFTSIHV
jgi:hypothetical protein